MNMLLINFKQLALILVSALLVSGSSWSMKRRAIHSEVSECKKLRPADFSLDNLVIPDDLMAEFFSYLDVLDILVFGTSSKTNYERSSDYLRAKFNVNYIDDQINPYFAPYDDEENHLDITTFPEKFSQDILAKTTKSKIMFVQLSSFYARMKDKGLSCMPVFDSENMKRIIVNGGQDFDDFLPTDKIPESLLSYLPSNDEEWNSFGFLLFELIQMPSFLPLAFLLSGDSYKDIWVECAKKLLTDIGVILPWAKQKIYTTNAKCFELCDPYRKNCIIQTEKTLIIAVKLIRYIAKATENKKVRGRFQTTARSILSNILADKTLSDSYYEANVILAEMLYFNEGKISTGHPIIGGKTNAKKALESSNEFIRRRAQWMYDLYTAWQHDQKTQQKNNIRINISS